MQNSNCTDTRMDFLRQLQEHKQELILSAEDSRLKQFIRNNIAKFISRADCRNLYSMLRDCSKTTEDIVKLMEWHGFGIYSATQKQLLDLMYDPTTSVLFRDFRKLLPEKDGVATAVYVLGKRAVVVTNKSNINKGSYTCCKSMGGSVPDIHIIPWEQLDTETLITEV